MKPYFALPLFLNLWLVLLGSFLTLVVSGEAAPTILPTAVPGTVLNFTAGAYPMNVAYDPVALRYYGGTGGSPGVEANTWDASGTHLLRTQPINVDLRSIYYNPNTGAIETVSYGANSSGFSGDVRYGLLVLGRDGSGLLTASNNRILAAPLSTANAQAVVAYDPGRNRIYSRSGTNIVQITNRADGTSLGTITLNLVAAGSPSLQSNSIAYDLVNDVLIGMDGGTKRAHVWAIDGSYLGFSQLPVGTAIDGSYCLSYANGQVFVSSSGQTAFRGFQIFSLATAPAVTTNAASGVGTTVVTLNGSVNPNGATTDAFFEYSTVSDLSSGVTTTASQAIGSGTSAVAVTRGLTGLQPLTTYYYRAAATNSGGATNGTILSFTTLAPPPTVVTLPATLVVPTGALLNGTVNPNGGSTDARFEYSTDPGLSGSILTPLQNIGAGVAVVPVSTALTDLVPKTTYYYRAVATNSGGTVNGSILSFTTNVVSWGGTGADSTTGVLDASLIPTSGTHTFSDVNGQGYYVVVTTSGLNKGGSASYFGDPGWWFEGGGPSSGYGTVTFQFFDSLTNAPRAISGVDFRLLDAEINERFRNFGYWDENNNFVSVAYGTGLLTFSHTPIFHATDGSYDNNVSQEGGDQVGKWVELNLSNLAVTGFTFQAHRQTSGAGSVIMSDLISPWAGWRTANFGAPPYPSTANDLANPDADGSVNILEYFYGTDPNVVDSPDPLLTSIVASRLTLTFPRNLAATDTTATVQGADSASGPWTDLARSTNGGAFVPLVGGVPVSEVGAGVIRTVEVGDEFLVGDPLHPTRFLRLQVVH